MTAYRPLAFVLVLAACGSAPEPRDPAATPDAPPLTLQRNEAAAAAAQAPRSEDRSSQSRVLACVNGEVINYRDVLLRAGPQLATVGTDEERDEVERATLLELVQERVLHRAAVDAGIDLTRDELDKLRAQEVRRIEQNGGTLEKYLAERGMTRREFDDGIRRMERIFRYLRAAIGVGGPGMARVRPVADTYVAPGEIQAYYRRNLDKFVEEEVARVRVLKVSIDRSKDDAAAAEAEARRTAEAALARLRAGEDFVPVFRDVNRGNPEPDADDGLIEIRSSERGKYAPFIESHAYDRPRGTLSEVEKRGGTFYVLRAEGHTPQRQIPYDEVHGTLQQLLGRIKQRLARYEVALSLLEDAAMTPPELKRELREYLDGQRKAILAETGI